MAWSYPKGALPYKLAHDAINIIRAINAVRITAKLNLLIRLPYASSQLIFLSMTGVRLICRPIRWFSRTVLTRPLDPPILIKNCPEKQIYLQSW
jgi:hypothetical protein